MAMIKTSEIQTFIQNQVSATSGPPYGFYIGLKEVGTSNTFIWNDNSELNYTNWNSGQPSNYPLQLCVAMGWWHTYYANLPWYDVDCAANAPTGFVGQRFIGEPYTFYIGLVYDKSKSMFQWNDGTNLSFPLWDEGEPNSHISGTETCVSIGEQKTYDANLLWHTRDCITGATGSKGFVCQRIIGE
ncbi:C-type mannose receptor 2-like [Styela clava]